MEPANCLTLDSRREKGGRGLEEMEGGQARGLLLISRGRSRQAVTSSYPSPPGTAGGRREGGQAGWLLLISRAKGRLGM